MEGAVGVKSIPSHPYRISTDQRSLHSTSEKVGSLDGTKNTTSSHLLGSPPSRRVWFHNPPKRPNTVSKGTSCYP